MGEPESHSQRPVTAIAATERMMEVRKWECMMSVGVRTTENRSSRLWIEELVVDDLRPRFHGRSPLAQPRQGSPFALHLLRFQDADAIAGRGQDVDRAEVDAADLRGLVVEDAGKGELVGVVDL